PPAVAGLDQHDDGRAGGQDPVGRAAGRRPVETVGLVPHALVRGHGGGGVVRLAPGAGAPSPSTTASGRKPSPASTGGSGEPSSLTAGRRLAAPGGSQAGRYRRRPVPRGPPGRPARPAP